MNAMPSFSITLALTGASGARYGLRLLRRLLAAGRGVDLLVSGAARVVLDQECGLELADAEGEAVVRRIGDHFAATDPPVPDLALLRHHALNDWRAPMASGSSGPRAMVVCPCSMGTLSAIAGGASDNLIERAADVAIKEGWPLILVPRETPLSVIHLENMLTLARIGVVILPAAPGFYHRPERVEELVDFLVDRVLARLGIPVDPVMPPWPSA